jgi:solute carrier family 8 (sodium/calcium exchanger)
MMQRLKTFDAEHLGSDSWKDQWVAAVYINGSYEEQKDASALDWVLHTLSLPFKLVFALTPPPQILNGWPAFWISLGFIAALTAFVGDTAQLFGCVMQVPDEITAITFVALGTSLPDTFASKTAAMEEPYADASVGNVTGSNSVNVFLGLGIAWTIGSVYWGNLGATSEWQARYKHRQIMCVGDNVVTANPDGAFVVFAGSLGFSVLVYTSLAVFGTALLQYRRVHAGGELGGEGLFKRISAAIFFCLWLSYVGANILFFVTTGSGC